MGFQKATKKQAKLRMALAGPSGSGKTYTALTLGTALGEKVAVIDTERGSASKYAGSDGFEFDVMELETFHPQKFIDGIHEAEAAGYDVLIIDSLSHAWMGKDGALELVDKAAARSKSGNSFTAWREVTPLHNALVDAILQARMHIIVTMRSKTEYVMETGANGKQTPRKIGMAPVQRDGMEYEFDIVGDMDFDNNFIVTKTRCKALIGAVINKPGKDTVDVIKTWLTDGQEVIDKVKLSEAKHMAVSVGYTSREMWHTLLTEVFAKTEDQLTNADLDLLIHRLHEQSTVAAAEEPTDDDAQTLPLELEGAIQ